VTREEFDAFCKKHLTTDAQRLDLLAQLRASNHPEAAQLYAQLAEAYFLDTGTWPKVPAVN
jgi:hypothetical protein